RVGEHAAPAFADVEHPVAGPRLARVERELELALARPLPVAKALVLLEEVVRIDRVLLAHEREPEVLGDGVMDGELGPARLGALLPEEARRVQRRREHADVLPLLVPRLERR